MQPHDAVTVDEPECVCANAHRPDIARARMASVLASQRRATGSERDGASDGAALENRRQAACFPGVIGSGQHGAAV